MYRTVRPVPMLWAALVLSVGCSEEVPAPEDACVTIANQRSLVLGTWTDDLFTAFETGAVLPLIEAPQGGLGVEIQAQTTGLGEGPFVVELDVELNAENLGHFENDAVPAFCQSDSSGLINTLVVGFSPMRFSTSADFAEVTGNLVDLIVIATDADGNTATGTIAVEVDIGS